MDVCCCALSVFVVRYALWLFVVGGVCGFVWLVMITFIRESRSLFVVVGRRLLFVVCCCLLLICVVRFVV